MAEAEERAASPLRHVAEPGPSPSRGKYITRALLDLIAVHGPGQPRLPDVVLRRKAQQRAEKKRQAKEAELKRVGAATSRRKTANEAGRRQKAQEGRRESEQRERRRVLRSDIIEGHKLPDEVQKHLQLEDMNKQLSSRQFDSGTRRCMRIRRMKDSTTAAQVNARRRREYQSSGRHEREKHIQDIIGESESTPGAEPALYQVIPMG